jgi:hypothetical protein
MHECIIVYRLRVRTHERVQVLYDNDDPNRIKVFPNRDAAIDFADADPFFGTAADYQIVELDEL